MLRFLTAGESHGPALTLIVDGLPSGLEVRAESIDEQLRRRQAGYGRGGRMSIERDTVRILGGVRHGLTLGGPVAMVIENRDWPNWSEAMAVEPPLRTGDALRPVRSPRPGHADLAGALKHGTHDARNVLERASARETTARVAAGSLARLLLGQHGIEIASHTVQVGAAAIGLDRAVPWQAIASIAGDSPMRCADPVAERAMMREVDEARAEGDSVGGASQVVARGVPPGLGSCRLWDTRLEGRLGQALLSIHAVKAVEIGEGVAGASRRGSAAHDEIFYDAGRRRFERRTNRAGGIEGGMSNGEEIRATVWVKPLSTLPRPLRSVDLLDKSEAAAAVERTDTCVVPAAGVIAEAMMAFVLAEAFLEKFGGDSIAETARNHRAYLDQVESF